jgi:hypothetical protein
MDKADTEIGGVAAEAADWVLKLSSGQDLWVQPLSRVVERFNRYNRRQASGPGTAADSEEIVLVRLDCTSDGVRCIKK